MFRGKRHLYLAVIATACFSVLAQAQPATGINCDASKTYRTDSNDPIELYCAASALESNEKTIRDSGKVYLRAFRLAFEKVEGQIRDRLDIRNKGPRPPFMSSLETLRPSMQLAVETAKRLEKVRVSDRDRDDALQKAKSLLGLFAISEPIYSHDEVDSDMKTTKKPRPGYTDGARENGVRGTVILLAIFGADGRVKKALPFATLRGGLTDRAIKAAYKIEFKPAVKNGKPVSIIKWIEYTFDFY